MAEERFTFCRICEPMCGLKVEVDGSRVLAIRGDPEHPLSKGWICRRGVSFAEIHNDPDRLRQPLRRGSRGMEPLSWDRALEEVAGRLMRIRDTHGPESIAVYMGNPIAFCTYGTLAVPAFVSALGTHRFYTAGSQDGNNKFAAAERVFGSPVLQPVPDLHHVQYLLVIGSNPVVSGMSVVQVPRRLETMRNIRRRGGEIVVVDPRRTETARIATEHLFIEPDTDCFFLLSLLHVLIDKGLADSRWTEEDPKGFAVLREVVALWPPERTEGITGIPRDRVERIALALAGPRPAAAYGSLGINLGLAGTLNYWLLLVLNLLSGHFDRKGGCFLDSGLMDIGTLYRLSGMGKTKERPRIGDFEPVMGTYPAALLASEILREGRPGVRALVVVAGNPLLSVPNEEHLKEALRRLDLLVCLDIYANETGAFAHYLLPATDFLEREDLNLSHTALQFRRHAAFTPAVVRPDGEQRPEWRILEDLADRMGLPLWGGMVGRVIRLAARMPIGKGLWRGCEDEGRLVMPKVLLKALLRILGEEDLPALESATRGILLREFEFGRLRKSRYGWRKGLRPRLAPPDLVREAWKLEGLLALRRAEGAEFRLIGKRERHTHNTWMHNADGLVRGERTNFLYIHPRDAARKGIKNGEQVVVENTEGIRIEVPCRLSTEMKPGVVALPHGWGHRYGTGWTRARRRPGVNVNRLSSDSVWKLEPVAGMAWLNGFPVTIQRAEGKENSREDPPLAS